MKIFTDVLLFSNSTQHVWKYCLLELIENKKLLYSMTLRIAFF